MPQSETDAFWALLQDFDTAMVVTRDGGALRARPMAPRIPKSGGEIHFLTERPSHKVEEIEQDSSVAATFSKHGKYLSVSGTARILTDRASVAEIWDAQAEAWLPQGKEDPSVVVLAIDPHMAEIWDVKANKVTQAYEFAKAYLGGQDRPDVGESRTVEL